jgi:hypothetical protein
VIVEAYPSPVRNRYPKGGRAKGRQDAYAITRWLAGTDPNGFLPRYVGPPPTGERRRVADLDGRLLGVS